LGLYLVLSSIFALLSKTAFMIQRIQTVYLFLAALVSGVLIWVVEFYLNGEGNEFVGMDESLYFGIFMGSSLMSVIAVFLFRNRQLQTVVNRLNLLLNLFILGVYVYQSLMMSGETAVSEKGIGMFIPILSIVLIVLANKAIRKDEQLVKSADRLR
jgi:surface polysaccharide O-acyltransferase-like enzyme